MHAAISATLSANPMLTLFVVIGLGYLLGQINFWGFRLGIAGVLFTGIAVGALGPDIHIPEAVASLGLIIFVYTLGIQAGPAFFSGFRKQGARQMLLAVSVLVVGFFLTVAMQRVLGLSGPRAAGLYAGALTSTPTLAAVRDRVKEVNQAKGITGEELQKLANEPVVGYGITYPLGVIGVLLLFQITRRIWKVDLSQRTERPEIHARDFVVENPAVVGRTLAEVMSLHEQPGFVISRLQQNGRTELPKDDTVLSQGDVIVVVGDEDGLRRAEFVFGGRAEEQHIEQDRSELDFRRILVSSKDVVGKRVGDLDLPNKLGATITRIRRGDVELVPMPHTRLEYGDSLRVVSTAENFPTLSRFFGDSIRGSAETQFGSVAIGLVIGVLVGMFPIPLPNGQTLRLGLAGGPLLVALVLGWMERTGGITWIMPASANLTLRQVGSVLFLAGVGTNAGYSFVDTLRSQGLRLLLAGAVLTLVVNALVLIMGHKVLKLPFDYLMGLASGIQTQAACVAYADEVTRSEAPSLAYASIYPAAMITKIVLAQLLL